MTGSPRRSPEVARLGAVLVLVALFAGACGSSGPTPSPATSAGTSPSTAELTPVPGGPTASRVAPSGTPTQTDTDWGRIWDALPDSFPSPPVAIPADSIEGPVSAAFSVGSGPVEATVAMMAALDKQGYTTNQSGPLEDGSFVVDSVGVSADCHVQVTLKPLSGTTLMTVLFGAGCPFE